MNEIIQSFQTKTVNSTSCGGHQGGAGREQALDAKQINPKAEGRLDDLLNVVARDRESEAEDERKRAWEQTQQPEPPHPKPQKHDRFLPARTTPNWYLERFT